MKRCEKKACKAYKWKFLMEKNTLFIFPFWRYFEKIYQDIFIQLKQIQNDISPYSFRSQIASHMNFLLLDLVKRVLVWEFNLTIKKHQITLDEFILNISSSDQVSKLFIKYPVLSLLFNNILYNYETYLTELISRLSNDFLDLKKKFQLTECLLKSIVIKGDSHCLGKRVTEISFYNLDSKEIKKLIYKPRDVELELSFNKLLEYINLTNYKMNLKKILVCSKGSYGWVEYVIIRLF